MLKKVVAIHKQASVGEVNIGREGSHFIILCFIHKDICMDKWVNRKQERKKKENDLNLKKIIY